MTPGSGRHAGEGAGLAHMDTPHYRPLSKSGFEPTGLSGTHHAYAGGPTNSAGDGTHKVTVNPETGDWHHSSGSKTYYKPMDWNKEHSRTTNRGRGFI